VRRRIVTFSGGLGAQILSAGIYFNAEFSSQEIYADLRYFQQPARAARLGTGEVSLWPWHLGIYGHEMSRFRSVMPRRHIDTLIEDGVPKLELALAAFLEPRVREQFPLGTLADAQLASQVTAAAVIHLRRGDYLNVASHIVDDKTVGRLLSPLAELVRDVVLVSDGPISGELLSLTSGLFEGVRDASDLPWDQAHIAMRMARVLVTSNSQFSLAAGLLREHGLTITPAKWWGPELAKLEQRLALTSDFRILRT
jgi:hypothetical protein